MFKFDLVHVMHILVFSSISLYLFNRYSIRFSRSVRITLRQRKSDLIIKELPEDMKLLSWRSLQDIKDERLLVFVLSRVVVKEFRLDEMVTEFQK